MCIEPIWLVVDKMNWEDKILNSDAGRSSPAKALELIEKVKSEGACISSPQKEPAHLQVSSDDQPLQVDEHGNS